ncbi:SDR family NAD(P)-dependent oxidoreductase [Nocardioides sp. zg-DK7169]|uniref:SDR family NAD(P)-dependent oxidoreductase n=1 Tax=Nocardioides sp. zg-DK7169 TaxID=2736600 RepID=UPI0015572EC9|nr:SDR family NAD(P)-dependent oxidoreductase [Nocardioides sp. zg-DK7169]NPC98144.1 SDR family NAD(P)-dependent oxidoreductase [Nocardioides sp. zg-DK7169]
MSDAGRSGPAHLAIVTGASRGIGRAMARRLAADGMAVAAVSRTLRPGDGSLAGSLEETVELIRADGGVAQAFVADLGDPGLDRPALVARIEEEMGADVDVLVNNAAATRHYEAGFLDVPREWFMDSLETNVWNSWDLARAVVPSMRRRGAGWILNISSRSAGPRVGPPFAPHPLKGAVLYAGTKAMIDRITTGMAMELHDDGIAVNALSPNRGVATENAANAVPGWPSEPEETMAEAALLLCSADPREVTGRVAYSLPLLKKLNRPVRTLDGRDLVPGWQPEDLDEAGFLPEYLHFHAAPPVPAALLAEQG